MRSLKAIKQKLLHISMNSVIVTVFLKKYYHTEYFIGRNLDKMMLWDTCCRVVGCNMLFCIHELRRISK